MNVPEKGSRYVLISPVKDEEKYVETTIRAVLNQTIRPYRWVLVDDGSKDRTREILESYARTVDWMTVITTRRDAQRQPGSGIIRAFNEGFRLVQNGDFDFVVKLDCDADLPTDYFERLIERFRSDNKLGIASGVFFERRNGKWTLITMPSYHAAGMSKVVRRECFQEIGGFVASAGWDSYDEIKAQVAGWTTSHFKDVQCYHLKREGSSVGSLRTNVMLGRIHYLIGGGPLFFALKCMYYAFTQKPLLLGATVMFAGYLKARLSGENRLVNTKEAKFYRNLLNQRIVGALSDIVPWGKTNRGEQPA